MQYEGTITKMLDKELVGQNQMPKRTIVLEEITDKEYKGGLVVDFLKEKVDLLDKYKVGDEVIVSLNTRASEYNGRWFNNVNGWRIEAFKDEVQADETMPDDSLPF